MYLGRRAEAAVTMLLSRPSCGGTEIVGCTVLSAQRVILGKDFLFGSALLLAGHPQACHASHLSWRRHNISQPPYLPRRPTWGILACAPDAGNPTYCRQNSVASDSARGSGCITFAQ